MQPASTSNGMVSYDSKNSSKCATREWLKPGKDKAEDGARKHPDSSRATEPPPDPTHGNRPVPQDNRREQSTHPRLTPCLPPNESNWTEWFKTPSASCCKHCCTERHQSAFVSPLNLPLCHKTPRGQSHPPCRRDPTSAPHSSSASPRRSCRTPEETLPVRRAPPGTPFPPSTRRHGPRSPPWSHGRRGSSDGSVCRRVHGKRWRPRRPPASARTAPAAPPTRGRALGRRPPPPRAATSRRGTPVTGTATARGAAPPGARPAHRPAPAGGWWVGICATPRGWCRRRFHRRSGGGVGGGGGHAKEKVVADGEEGGCAWHGGSGP